MSDLSQYREMLREVQRETRQRKSKADGQADGKANKADGKAPVRPLKRRKRNRSGESREQSRVKSKELSREQSKEQSNDHREHDSPIDLTLDTESDSVSEVKPKVFINENKNDKMEVKFEPVENSRTLNVPAELESHDHESSEVDSDEFENVDLHLDTGLDLQLQPPQLDLAPTITVSIAKPAAVPKNTKKNVNMIDRDEKLYRKSFHMGVILAMACHGVLRNQWINDDTILAPLRLGVPRDIKRALATCLAPDPDLAEMPYLQKQIHSRKLLDCLKRLMEFWNEDFTVNNEVGFYKKSWAEIAHSGNQHPAKSISKLRFRNRILKKRGSRDVAAQGFVALLRSVGLHCRLVFSVQPPDFTNNIKAEVETRDSTPDSESVRPRPSRSPLKKSLKGLRPGEKLLLQFRNKKVATNDDHLGSQSIDKESEFPVFWAEVWDKFTKKWISVDAVCFKYIENVRTSSRFEPPATDDRNNAYYVLGYDNDGRVRDVTRRYARNYNAKTRKKRITREPRWQLWYDRLLCSLCSNEARLMTGMDVKELEYFKRKSLQEGMPNSIQDFKNHPVYVLEEHLKSNEILSPRTPCGRTRKKNSKSAETIPVYKRENVHHVRSAKAWFLKGRVLKVGERPMIIKKLNKNDTVGYEDDLFGDGGGDGDNDDSDTRLYLESQTELYHSPLIVDGEVPKNAFGNIDLYVDSMLPANGCYRESKFAQKAAKSLGIDYADACVGFDFGKGGASTARIKGVVVLKEFEDAMAQVELYMELEEHERLRKRQELIALRGWRLLLAKLRIRDELNRKYGNIDGMDDAVELQFKKIEARFAEIDQEDRYDSGEDDIYGEYYEGEEEKAEGDDYGEEDDYGGGFIPEENAHLEDRNLGEVNEVSEDDSEPIGGGFYIGDEDENGAEESEGLANNMELEYSSGLRSKSEVTPESQPFAPEFEPEFEPESGFEPQFEPASADPHLNKTTTFQLNSQSDDDIYDPALQDALLDSANKLDLSHASFSDNPSDSNPSNPNPSNPNPHSSDHPESDNDSIDSLELANQGVSYESDLDDQEYFDDNDFEYSDE